MIDIWRLSRSFKTGDHVQRYWHNGLSTFVGRVTAVHRGIGYADVQWTHGNERVACDELVKVDPKMCMFVPPELDQSYQTYDVARARARWGSEKIAYWRGATMPRGFYIALAQAWSSGASEVAAYDSSWHRFAAQGCDDDALRDEVAKFYRVSSRLADMRIEHHVAKAAAYWVAQNRQYRLSQGELTAKKPNCPKCGTEMRRTTYKMREGSRHRLFACPKDLFLIKTESFLGPAGEPVGW